MVANLSGLSSAWNSIENDNGTIASFCIDGVTYEVIRTLVENEIRTQSDTTNHSLSSITTIMFRVGGVTHEVSRSLVEAFPTTMLFRLLSDAMNTSATGIEPIFVECNGNRFEYVLEYMRYGKVFLPDCILKEALLHDLKYLGFESVNQSDIKSHSEALDNVPLLASDCQTETSMPSPPSPRTVSFRVGGVTYEVSCSLVEKFPNTMLFKLLSERRNSAEFGSEGIFIGSNGTRFEYVLDYMRDGKVCIPESIPKEAFLQDMTYLGFGNVDQSDIKCQSQTINHSPQSLTTVSFCVGGVTYQMNRSLVESFPDTMLFKLLSERKTSVEDSSEAIFIDRNGSRFEYILDYMRDENVSLPECIPKDVFLREMKYLGFENVNQHNIKSHSTTLNQLPHLVSNFKGVQDVELHEVTWDVKRPETGLDYENKNLTVRKAESKPQWRSIFGTEGFSSGIHYWNIEIVHTEKNSIMIGISKYWTPGEFLYPGLGNSKGVSYYGANGNRFCADTYTSFGPTYTKGDVIGTLLNMNQKTVAFYKNGVAIGTELGINLLTDNVYYPCICLCTRGDKIMSSNISLDY